MRAAAVLPTGDAVAYLGRLSAAYVAEIVDRVPDGHAVDAVEMSFSFGRYRVELAVDALRLDLVSNSEEGLAYLKVIATSHLSLHRAGTGSHVDWTDL